jgi:alpha-glucoside transport system substrate-binding protein
MDDVNGAGTLDQAWRPSGAARGRAQMHGGIPALVMGAIVVAACSSAATGPAPSNVVSVLGSWEGPELDSFEAMVAPFERDSGIKVEYSATRDLQGVISRGIATGHPPDVAGLPGPGYMLRLARSGDLKDLSAAVDLGAYKRETAPAFVDLGTIDGKLVGVFIKGTVKGLLWFNPAVYRQGTPGTWSELVHMAGMAGASNVGGGTRPWCVGLESGASSGWPGTDWIEDFLLRQSGPKTYDAWIAGELPWDSPEVRAAFRAYGQVVAEDTVLGGARGALTTYFAKAGDPLFGSPPGCLFLHQGSFMTTFLDAVSDPPPAYDFMPFPDIDPRWPDALIGAGDLFGMLNDTPESRALIRYLVTAEAQAIWVGRGGALSGNFNVDTYPTEIARREAALLTRASIFRFDASDSMPDDMGKAFWQAILDYTGDQTKLDAILRQLDAVRAVAYQP